MIRWISASVLFVGLAAAPLMAQTSTPARRGTPPPATKPAAPATAKPATPATAKPATAAPAARPPSTQAAAAYGPGIYAVFTTTNGNFIVHLLDQDAPKTVANFVGLATGRKAWKDPRTGAVVHRPLYNNTLFHRVIPNFMIQGGDPKGDGTGGPGTPEIANEISPKYHHDKAGIMSMANHGPDTNGSQFFITVAPYPSLDGHYSIFGEVVEGLDNVIGISKVPRTPGENRPITPVVMKTVRIETVK